MTYTDFVLSTFQQSKDTFKSKFRWNVDHMNLIFHDTPMNTNGDTYTCFKPEQCAASWTKHNIIYFASELHIKKVILHFNLIHTPYELVKLVLPHELAHEVYNSFSIPERLKWATTAKLHPFNSEYLNIIHSFNLPQADLDEETFCEYIVHLTYHAD